MARGSQGRLLPVYLEADQYQRLERFAQSQDREAIQQAQHFIKRALAESMPADREPTPPGAGRVRR